MKTKQIIKKAICFMISALLLTTSLPMQVFAQDVTSFYANIERTVRIHEVGSLSIIEHVDTGVIKLYRRGLEDPVLSQRELKAILGNPELMSKLFGEVDTYAKYARIQATQAKGGEGIVTILADGTRETSNVAKAGEWIVTNPGGEQYIVPADKFAKKYEAAAELGEGWFKPKGTPQKFRQIKVDMKIKATWGEEQVLKRGAYINVTNMDDLYGVGRQEFYDTYKTIKVLYRENLTRIGRFVSKVETKLYQRFPRYQGVFFKKFLRNDVEFMVNKLEQKAARRAALKRVASRAFTGTIIGIGLYMGLTLISAPEVQAQNVSVKSRNKVISELKAEVEANAEKKQIFEKMRSFADGNYAAVIISDAVEGNGELLNEMGTVIPTIEASGLTEDEAADLIVDEAEDPEETYSSMFYNAFENINLDTDNIIIQGGINQLGR